MGCDAPTLTCSHSIHTPLHGVLKTQQQRKASERARGPSPRDDVGARMHTRARVKVNTEQVPLDRGRRGAVVPSVPLHETARNSLTVNVFCRPAHRTLEIIITIF